MMRSSLAMIACWSLLVGLAQGGETDAPTDASTDAATDAGNSTPSGTSTPSAAPTAAPTAAAPEVKIEFEAYLELSGDFSAVNETAIRNSVTSQFSGSDVVVTMAYKTTVLYDFAADVTFAEATTAVANTCGVTEDKVNVFLRTQRLLSEAAASSRQLAATSVNAEITAATPDAAQKVMTASGNASAIADAMSDASGKNIDEPRVWAPTATIAMTTSVTAKAGQDLATLQRYAASNEFKTYVASAGGGIYLVTVEAVKVITQAPTSAAPTAAPTTAPTNVAGGNGGTPTPTNVAGGNGGTPTPTVAPTAATPAGTNANGTTANGTTPDGTSETESMANKCGIQVLLAIITMVLPHAF